MQCPAPSEPCGQPKQGSDDWKQGCDGKPQGSDDWKQGSDGKAQDSDGTNNNTGQAVRMMKVITDNLTVKIQTYGLNEII